MGHESLEDITEGSNTTIGYGALHATGTVPMAHIIQQ